MRKGSLVFLIVGFAAGFGILYAWTRQRAPQIVSAIPAPFQQNGSPQPPPDAPPPPAVDVKLVAQLQDRVKSDPKDFEALVQLGNIDFDQRNFGDASEYYKKALNVRPDDLNVRTDMGTALFYQNRYDEAIAEFKKTLAVDPNHAQTLFNMGVVLLHGKNDRQGAVDVWQKLLDTNPDFPQADVVRQEIESLKAAMKK